MITITTGNSFSRIQGLTLTQEKKLRSEISYAVGGSAAYFSGYGVRRKSLIDKRGSFPTGLLHRIVDFLLKNKAKFDIIDVRVEPKNNYQIPSDLEKAYPWQQDALYSAVLAKRGIISATTGSGKSRVIGLIASALNAKTLVVVPSLEIKKQLSDGLKALKNVTVLNIDSSELKTATDFDCLIIDEAHHAAAKTYRQLNKTAWQGIYYRFFLTATPFRNDTEEQLLFESIAGQVIYTLGYKAAVKCGYVVPVEAYYVDLPKQETDAFTWQEVYRDLVVHNEYRNTVVLSHLIRLLYSNEKSTLVLVKEVKHGNILSKLTATPFVHGNAEDRSLIEQFSRGELPVLIATEGVCGEGVDTKACEFVILAGLGKAKSAIMQKVGRCVRTYPGKETGKVIIFRDPSHKFCLKHFREQCKILKDEYGVKPIKMEIT